MRTPYEIAAAYLGEVRIYLQTAESVVTEDLRSVLGYAYSHQRDRRNASDSWESAFGDARQIESEVRFDLERERVVSILRAQVAGHWEADVLYYPRGQAQALYHWSSSEGTLHPYRTISE